MASRKWSDIPDALRRVVVACERKGVVITRTGKGHLRWEFPSGRIWCSASHAAKKGTVCRAQRYARAEGIQI